MKYIILALGFGLVASLAGCRSDDNKVSTTETTSATLTKPSLAKEDREFVTKATQSGMLEVALGNHVSREAASKDTREFGEQMVTDHSVVDDELKNIAALKGVNVPKEMDSDHRATYDKLAKLKGNKLDSHYADEMVDAQEAYAKELQDAARDLKDPDLRAWASKTLPTLELHVAKAKELRAKHH
jgi:putative membrane protein